MTTFARGWRSLLLAALVLPFVVTLATAAPVNTEGSLYRTYAEVQDAQAVLEAEGYLHPGTYTTGQMDPATLEALRAFQEAHFLPPSGRLDQDTISQLMSHMSALTVAEETTP